jgi:hypothetical protein
MIPPKIRGQNGNIVFVFLGDSTSTTGAGKTAITHSSAGLNISIRRELAATFTASTGANLGAVATLGTWVDPGAGKANIGECDATNTPGLYEVHLPNVGFGTGDTSRCIVGMVTGTGLVPAPFEAPLWAVDPQDGVHFALTSLPNVASGSAGAIPTTGTGANQISVASGQVILQAGTGAGQIDFTTGVVKANLAQILGTALTETAGQIAAGFKKFFNITVPTLTVGGTDQTGDSYARIGANGAGLTGITGVTLATGQHVIVDSGTVTTLTSLPSIPANWITAAGINAGALNGKGDWSTYAGGDTAGTTTLLSRIASAITISAGAVTVGTNNDKTGYTASTVSDKTGYALSAVGLDLISVADPGAAANLTTFPKIMVWLFRRFFKKTAMTSTQVKTFADDGTTVNVTQTVSDDGTTQTQGAGA